eukprot:6934733-Alexandrium_andersonii.AAC.1
MNPRIEAYVSRSSEHPKCRQRPCRLTVRPGRKTGTSEEAEPPPLQGWRARGDRPIPLRLSAQRATRPARAHVKERLLARFNLRVGPTLRSPGQEWPARGPERREPAQ